MAKDGFPDDQLMEKLIKENAEGLRKKHLKSDEMSKENLPCCCSGVDIAAGGCA